jgi:hypothetical protein
LVAVTENDAVAPSVTVALFGWLVIVGGMPTLSLMAPLSAKSLQSTLAAIGSVVGSDAACVANAVSSVDSKTKLVGLSKTSAHVGSCNSIRESPI